MSDQLTKTLPALKEWALVCKLLLEGRQSIMLRKGGIDEKGFWVEADEFFLFPTYFHQMAEKVRPEYAQETADLLAAPPPEGLLRMSGVARVVEHIEVRRPEGMDSLRDLHPYDEEQVAMRLEFRPKKPLVILAVEVRPALATVETPMLESYGGCVSWVDVGVDRPALGEAVLPIDAVRATADRVKNAVG
ncbi:MAG: DUF1802 family protein [Actinomycetota bacterium]